MKKKLSNFFVTSGLIFCIFLGFGCENTKSDNLNAQKLEDSHSEVPERTADTVGYGGTKRPQGQEEAVESSKEISSSRINVVNKVADFGEVGPSSRHHSTFKFTNTGSSELKITRIQSTCGCTVPQLKKKNYAPGESGEIDVTFTAPSREGMVTKHLYVHSNDPAHSKEELLIKADVVLSVESEPKRLRLSLVEPSKVKPIVIESKDGRKFSIKSISDRYSVISADFDSSKESTKFVLEPKINRERLNQHNRGRVEINISHPQTSTVYVDYIAPEMFEVTRPRIIMRDAEPGMQVERDIWIRSNYDQKVNITSSSSQKGLLEITDQQMSSAGSIKLIVTATAPERSDEKSRYFTDTMTIMLDNGQKLKVSLSGWYKR